MLKVHIDMGSDYYDYLRPFIKYILSKMTSQVVIASEIRESIKKEFGLEISTRACEVVLQRIARKEKCFSKEDGQFRITKPIESSADFDTKRQEGGRRIHQTVVSFIDHCRLQFSIDWDESQAINALLAYLSQFATECLSYYTRGTPLPEVLEKDGKNILIVNSFVNYLSRKDESALESFLVLVKGHMLATALLCEDLESLEKKFSNITFYFDTPLIMHLLGLSGEHEKQATVELVELLKNLKGKICVFTHTVNEIKAVIRAYGKAIDAPWGYGKYIVNMRRSGMSKSDLLLKSENLEESLKDFLINEQRTPAHSKDFQIDEEILTDSIDDQIGHVNERALQNDVNSIRSIFELRRGQNPRKLEDSKAVFVTSNAALARVAYNFGKEYEECFNVSPVITEFSLANIAWLKAPVGASDMPRTRLMAICYAAMDPSVELWEKYSTEIEKLKKDNKITASAHEFLRSSAFASEKLMNITLGSPSDFDLKTIDRILEEAKKEFNKDKDEEINIKDVLIKEREEKILNLESESNKSSLKIEKANSQIFWIAESMGRGIGYGTFILLSLILIVGSIYMFLNNVLGVVGLMVVLVVGGAILISLFLNIIGIRKLAEEISRNITNDIYKRLIKFFKLD